MRYDDLTGKTADGRVWCAEWKMSGAFLVNSPYDEIAPGRWIVFVDDQVVGEIIEMHAPETVETLVRQLLEEKGIRLA